MLFSLRPAAAADIIVFVAPDGWAPYFTGEAENAGIAVDLLAELGQRTGLSMRVRYIPLKRGQELLRQGTEVNAEMLVAAEWRRFMGDSVVFSDPIMTGTEVIIFPPGKGFPVADIATDLRGLRGAFVLGQSHPDYGYIREDSPSDETVVRKVAAGRTAFGVEELNVAAYFAVKNNLRLDFGPIWSKYDYRLELHRSKADLLPRINAAIAQIKADGTVERTIARYTRTRVVLD